MATIFNQYLTKFIIQLLNEYGNYNSSDEKKAQRDTLIKKVTEFSSQEQGSVNDEKYQQNLLSIINKSRQEALCIATKTNGISSGGFEKFCDCATFLITETHKLFKENCLDDIKIDELFNDLNNLKEKFRVIYLLINRILLEYEIGKLKSSALENNGLDNYGYWKTYIKSWIPSINIDDEKLNVLKESTQELKKSVKYALERNITEEEMDDALKSLNRNLRITFDELRKTHGSKIPSFTDGLSVYTLAFSFSSMAVNPKDGESEAIILFLKDSLLPKLTNSKEFNKIPKQELKAMFSCNYKRIKNYLSNSIDTLTDGKQDSTIISNSISDSIQPSTKHEPVDTSIDDNDDAMNPDNKEESVSDFSFNSEQKPPKPGKMA